MFLHMSTTLFVPVYEGLIENHSSLIHDYKEKFDADPFFPDGEFEEK